MIPHKRRHSHSSDDDEVNRSEEDTAAHPPAKKPRKAPTKKVQSPHKAAEAAKTAQRHKDIEDGQEAAAELARLDKEEAANANKQSDPEAASAAPTPKRTRAPRIANAGVLKAINTFMGACRQVHKLSDPMSEREEDIARRFLQENAAMLYLTTGLHPDHHMHTEAIRMVAIMAGHHCAGMPDENSSGTPSLCRRTK